MSPADPSGAIAGARHVTAIFGEWPAFHDAEICALDVTGRPDGFIVTVALHAFVRTAEIDERGNYRLARHTRVTLRFSGCTDLRLDALDGHTTLFALHLTPGPSWTVVFESTSGPDGSLRCERIEVVEAVPWPASST
ncbi:MAG TPA: Imm50 family immunity protein [Opitutus sp.]|nr:Imm50 family immunity protein [Opitutus sp.]